MKKRVVEKTVSYYILKLRDKGDFNIPKTTNEIAGLLRTYYAKKIETNTLSRYLIGLLRNEEIKRVMIGNKPYWYNKNVSDENIKKFIEAKTCEIKKSH
jgi:hypothetical protein